MIFSKLKVFSTFDEIFFLLQNMNYFSANLSIEDNKVQISALRSQVENNSNIIENSIDLESKGAINEIVNHF